MFKLPERMKHTQKIKAIMDLIKKEIGEISMTEVYSALCHITWSMKREVVTPLTENEKMISDLFAREGIHPGTTYSWFGFFRLDKDLQNDVKRGKLSFRMAERVQRTRRKESKEGLEKEILQDIKKIMNMLKDANNIAEVV